MLCDPAILSPVSTLRTAIGTTDYTSFESTVTRVIVRVRSMPIGTMIVSAMSVGHRCAAECDHSGCDNCSGF